MPVIRLVLAIAAAVWLLLWAASMALAGPCGPFEDVRDVLRSGYGEGPRFQGLTADSSAILIVMLNDATGTWTLLLVRPDGSACIAGAGSVGGVVMAEPAGVPG